jgi:two-component system, NarL family, sensor kinase
MAAPVAQPSADVRAVAAEHARRAAALQVAMRWVLVGFVALTVLAVPPARDLAACAALAAGYAVCASAVAWWARRGRDVWPALFVDVAVLGALTLVTGVTTPQGRTSDVLAAGFLLVPVLAATELRPGMCAAVVWPTVAVYFAAGVATRAADDEPWPALLLRTLVVAGVAAGCVGLSLVQRSRVATITGLVRTRNELLAELAGVEQRERRTLAEHLHDGALQYVLAARHDLEDARDGEPAAFDRLDVALAESSRLLRSTVAELHPAVLERAGLPAALRDLAGAAAARGGFAVDVRTDDWPDDLRTPADPLLYRTARELLANVAEHARAATASVSLERVGDRVRLVVVDDGVGVTDEAAARAVERGHIGLASHAVRVRAAGGRFTVAAGSPGTVAAVELPLPA